MYKFKYIGLAKKFIPVFVKSYEKPEQTFWPVQYLHVRSRSPISLPSVLPALFFPKVWCLCLHFFVVGFFNFFFFF